jgi:hypothetical protein
MARLRGLLTAEAGGNYDLPAMLMDPEELALGLLRLLKLSAPDRRGENAALSSGTSACRGGLDRRRRRICDLTKADGGCAGCSSCGGD